MSSWLSTSGLIIIIFNYYYYYSILIEPEQAPLTWTIEGAVQKSTIRGQTEASERCVPRLRHLSDHLLDLGVANLFQLPP